MKSKFIFIFFVSLFLLCSCKKKEPYKVKKAHEFMLNDINHKRFYLNEQKGSNVVLIFWATYCNICKKELKDFEELKSKIDNDKLKIISIVNDPENMELLKDIYISLGISYPLLLDYDKKVSDLYQIDALPVTVMIDPSGNEIFRRTGYNESIASQLKNKIKQQSLLKGDL